MKERNAEILLGSVIVARATSLLLSKLSMRSLAPFNLMGLRFCLAFLILALLFFPRLRGVKLHTVLRGCALGVAFFTVMALELNGLRLTDSSSTTSFLENTAIVWVPLFEAVIHRHSPAGKTLLSAGLTLLGVALLTLGRGGLRMGPGELLCLASSFVYALALLLTARLSREDEPLLMGIFQVGAIGVLALLFSFLLETPRLPQSGAEWGMIAALAVVCSCFGFTLQPVAQRHVSAERAGMFCALNPLTAALLGVLFLHERLGLWGLIGAGLILLGIAVQSLHLPLPHKKRAVAG